jgi:voltage-gated potassium channel
MNIKGKIFLFGYGSFGRHLYKHLSKQNNNIKVITSLEENVEFADENVDIVKINIRHNDDIKSLNINPKTDIIYCSMNKTANNLFLVLTLKTLYRDANIISISNSYENTRKLKYAGATNVIDLYEATSRRFVHILTKPAVTKAIDEIVYKQNDLKMAEVILPPNSPLEKKYVNDINFKSFGIVLIAIIDKEIGNDLIFIDHRVNHKLDAGDTLVVVAKMNDFDKFKKYLYKDKS